VFDRESKLFHTIAPAVIDHVSSQPRGASAVVNHKRRDTDYATEVDVSVENLIVAEIRKQFPDDEILAEEGLSDTSVTEKRIWIIDPICGTNNLGRGIDAFCTNIALAENKKVIASCVVDHSEGEYYWSIGEQTVHKGREKFTFPVQDKGVLVDVDLGSVPNLSIEQKARYTRTLQDILTSNDYTLNSLNTSLGYLYVALGRVDGFFCMYTHPWDYCAGAFLIQESGGIITGLDGEPWEIVDEKGLIAAIDPDVHASIVKSYTKAG